MLLGVNYSTGAVFKATTVMPVAHRPWPRHMHVDSMNWSENRDETN